MLPWLPSGITVALDPLRCHPKAHGTGLDEAKAIGAQCQAGAYAPALARGNVGPGIDERIVGQGAGRDREGHADAEQQRGRGAHHPWNHYLAETRALFALSTVPLADSAAGKRGPALSSFHDFWSLGFWCINRAFMTLEGSFQKHLARATEPAQECELLTEATLWARHGPAIWRPR